MNNLAFIYKPSFFKATTGIYGVMSNMSFGGFQSSREFCPGLPQLCARNTQRQKGGLVYLPDIKIPFIIIIVMVIIMFLQQQHHDGYHDWISFELVQYYQNDVVLFQPQIDPIILFVLYYLQSCPSFLNVIFLLSYNICFFLYILFTLVVFIRFSYQ